jgi:predicted nucleic acid-binding protein
MARYKIYPETSFWRRLGDPENPDLRKTSYRFFRSIQSRDRIHISKLVLLELSETPDAEERRHVLKRLWSARPKMVTTSRRAERIALELLSAGGWSEDVFADMLHVSYSMLSEVDALVTWDHGDLAREHTRKIVQAYGKRQRLSVPLIGTPEEVAEWLGLKIR